MDETVAEVRGFNRYYTNVIGALGEGHLHSPYTLTGARVLYELAQADAIEVADLRRRLGLDAGYLTRILTRFDADGLITRTRSTADARRQVTALTKRGRAAFAGLNRRATRDISRLLGPLSPGERERLRAAMRTVRGLLEHNPAQVALRELRPGDLGWIVERNAELYATEYGWDTSYETLVARIVAEYAASVADTVRAARDNAWIAELGGERAGCVMCVRGDDDATAKLRLLLVEPSARGLRLGHRLVGRCVEFARDTGYERMTLWTQSILTAARRIYTAYGFELVDSSPHRSFGADLVAETWTLSLR